MPRHHATPVAPSPFSLARRVLACLGLSWALFLASAACAGDSGQAHLGPLRLQVSYHGIDGCPLVELRIHHSLDDYGDATNLLQAPLEVGDATWFDHIEPGSYYVTVIRCQRPLPGSPLVALTTASPLGLWNGLHEVRVFEDFFRVLEPVMHPDAQAQP